MANRRSSKKQAKGSSFGLNRSNIFGFKKPIRALIAVIAIANVFIIFTLISLAYTAYLKENFEPTFHSLVNQHRANYDKAPLKRSKCLTNAARDYAKYLAANAVFAHSNIYAQVGKFCPNANSYGIGENLYARGPLILETGEYVAQEAFIGMKNSPSHNANLLYPTYNYAGYGAAWSKQGSLYVHYVVQMFVICTSTCGSEWTSPPDEVAGTITPTSIVGAALNEVSLKGYWAVRANGRMYSYGDAVSYGDLYGKTISGNIVGMAAPKFGGGYWIVTSTGKVYRFGYAAFHGDMSGQALNKPIVDIEPAPDGKGYWLLGADGGVFSFGSAKFYGSTGNLTLKAPVVGMEATPKSQGYWFVAAEGGVFSYGSAKFYGSAGNIALNQPVVDMAHNYRSGDPGYSGYWLLAADGGIFSYGDLGFYGSAAGKLYSGERATEILMYPYGGYWIMTTQGRILKFGKAF